MPLWATGRCSLAKTTSRRHGALSIRRLRQEHRYTNTNRTPGVRRKRSGSSLPAVGTIRRRRRKRRRFHIHLPPEKTKERKGRGTMRIEVLADADAVARKAAA